MNVLVINHFAPNKGDRAVLIFILRELSRYGVESITISARNRFPWVEKETLFDNSVKFVPWGWCITNSFNDTNNTHLQTITLRVKSRFFYKVSYPMVRYMVNKQLHIGFEWLLSNRKFWGALKEADFVISTGGHHVTTLLARDAVSGQLYDLALTLLAGKELALWSQSLGPFEFSELKNWNFVRNVLLGTREIIIRDAQSKGELAKLDVPTDDIGQTYDSVFGLNDAVTSYTVPSQREAVVGIAVYRKSRSKQEHSNYIQSLATVADHVIETGHTVRFFPMELKGFGVDDRALIREVVSYTKYSDQCEIKDEDMDTLKHISEVAKCRLFIGNKTHSVIFALTVGTPVLALAYHKKTEDFMEQYGLSEFCIPDSKLSADNLVSKFEKLRVRADTVGQKEFEKSREVGEIVRRDFRDMISRFQMRHEK